jgi:3-methyladenine DNA glycosylase/8-oxoguanine DNA glycosylase
VELRLVGPAGEPVDLWRTLVSHGLTDLPPARVDENARTYETTVPLARGRPRTIRLSDGRPGFARVEVVGGSTPRQLVPVVRRILNLDEDLSPLYALARDDPQLAWIARGAGRMLRAATVFEDVVKTICTTNIAWSATVRMTAALVDHLGEPSAGGRGRAFPSPAAMAESQEAFYRDVVRAGYRGAYLRGLAASVAEGAVDLEALLDPELADDKARERLLALPGIGPYAAAQVMMLLGRHSRLIFDSWTRPTYARINRRKAADRTIERRFRRYGPYAGLAFWLFLTRDWVR